MDALGLVEFDQFGRWVVWVEFYLVYGGHDLGVWVGEELFEIFLVEVADADVADFAGFWEFLKFSPVCPVLV